MLTHTFFLIVPPGLENLAKNELLRSLPVVGNDSIRVTRGGLELELPMAVGCELNRQLKIPTRILMRVAEFSARDFPKLFKRLLAVKWEEWFESHTQVDWQVSSHESRLRIKNRIADVAADAWKKHFKALPNSSVKGAAPNNASEDNASEVAENIFIRVQNDVVTVSLDTSGEPLYKRGVRTHVGVAPIRENLVAALLFHMRDQVATNHAGVNPIATLPSGVHLVDPMVGSGVFLLEAATLDSPNRGRTYAYETWKCFLRSNLKKNEALRLTEITHLRELNRAPQPTNGNDIEGPWLLSVSGFDSDAKTLAAAQHNWNQMVEMEPTLKNVPAQFVVQDLNSPLAPNLVSKKPIWLMANLPYGERIKVEGSLGLFIANTALRMVELFEPQALGLIFPQKARVREWPRGYQLRSELKFSNGGLAVTFAILAKA